MYSLLTTISSEEKGMKFPCYALSVIETYLGNLTERILSLDKLKDGFECPNQGQTDANGQVVVHPKYPHPTDCQRFYVCLNGQEPRDLGCIVGEVYNEESQKCDAPENVPGCEDWYKDDPLVTKPTKKSRK